MPAESEIEGQVVFKLKQETAVCKLVGFKAATFPVGGLRPCVHRKEWIVMRFREGGELAAGEGDAIGLMKTISEKRYARNTHRYQILLRMLRRYRGKMNKQLIYFISLSERSGWLDHR